MAPILSITRNALADLLHALSQHLVVHAAEERLHRRHGGLGRVIEEPAAGLEEHPHHLADDLRILAGVVGVYEDRVHHELGEVRILASGVVDDHHADAARHRGAGDGRAGRERVDLALLEGQHYRGAAPDADELHVLLRIDPGLLQVVQHHLVGERADRHARELEPLERFDLVGERALLRDAFLARPVLVHDHVDGIAIHDGGGGQQRLALLERLHLVGARRHAELGVLCDERLKAAGTGDGDDLDVEALVGEVAGRFAW